MKHLFSSYQIGKLRLKNRIVMPSVASFLVETDGTMNERAIEHYRIRASGGAAMVITEACAVSPEGVVSAQQARIYDDKFIKGLAGIAEIIRSEGAVPAVQIHHGGRQTSPKVIGRRPLAPSPLPCPAIRGEVEVLTKERIHELVMKFGDAAERAVEAGFELLEIHGGHGYLINQFLSPYSNIREDMYGGDTEGRSRFAVEIIEEIRRRIGNDYPLSFKISAQEFVENGLTVPESIKILKILCASGLDVVQVSAGNDATPEWICQPMYMERACLADSAAMVKQALDVPVMAVGRINDPLLAEEILSKGKADLICMGRGLLADPELPKKAEEGRLDEIRLCIACNNCMESIFKRGRVECLVNPSLGREKEMEIVPTSNPRNVVVVGGGPAGMNVAWTAAMRGHSVSLYEREGKLGGQIKLGVATEYKRELENLIKFQVVQLKKHNVSVHLQTEVAPELIQQIDPDVLILATGSVPVIPEIKGADAKMVVPIDKILSGESPEPMKTVVVGGGPTGCETALFLAAHGSDVVLIEMGPRLGVGIESINRRVLFRKMKEAGVKIKSPCEVVRILDHGVEINCGDTGTSIVEAERVMFAVGNRPDDTLYNRLSGPGYELHKIGDCMETRNAKSAILDGAVLGRSL
ncbi:MAG: FAD-dependent oxidoreductase [Desulfatiglandaceae bacterium]